MPFKSEAQRRKFLELVSQGKMSKDTFEEWNRETKEKLPERVGVKRYIKNVPKAKIVK